MAWTTTMMKKARVHFVRGQYIFSLTMPPLPPSVPAVRP